MIIFPRGAMRRALNKSGLWYLPVLFIKKEHVEDHLPMVRAHHASEHSHEDHAIFRSAVGMYPPVKWWHVLVLLLSLIFLVGKSFAQNPNVNVDRIGGTKVDPAVGILVNCPACPSGGGGGGGAITSPLDVSGNVKTAVQNATIAVTQSTSPWVVSGTVTANQGGTWTVQPGNTANTTAWKVDGSAVTQPVSGTFFQVTQPVSIASMPSTAVTNAGTFATQSTLAAETTKVIGTVNVAASQTIAATQATAANLNATVVGTGTFATQSTLAAETTKVIGTVNLASGQTLGTVSAVTAITNALPAGTNLLGKVGIDQTTPGTTNAVEPVPDTSAAVALTATSAATNTTAVVIKNSAGNVYGLTVTNGAASVCWVEFMNAASSPVLGTAAVFSIAMPASGTVNVPPGSFPLSRFSTGISVGTATLVNGSVACGTGSNMVVFYK